MGFIASSFFLHTRGIFFPIWMSEFAVDRTQMSLVISLTLFTSSCIAPVIGYLLDKLPIKVIICFGSCWLALGYGLLQWVHSYWQFFFLLVIFQGLGWGCVGPLTQTKLMVSWFRRNRGMALGIAIMGISVAGIIMPTVVTWLAENLGWQDTYLLYAGLLMFLVIPMSLLIVKQTPADIGQHPDGDSLSNIDAEFCGGSIDNQEAESAETKKPTVENSTTNEAFWPMYKVFLSSRAFWSVVITFGLMNGVYSAMITHLPSYLTTELNFTIYDSSYLLGISGGFAIIGKVLFGWLIDKWEAKRTVLIGVCAYLGSTLVFMGAESYALLIVAAALFGLGFGGMLPVRSVLISRLFGIEKFSRVNGLLSFFLAPATFWVLITGYIADSSGSYYYAFRVWACAFLLAGLVTVMIRLPNSADAID